MSRLLKLALPAMAMMSICSTAANAQGDNSTMPAFTSDYFNGLYDSNHGLSVVLFLLAASLVAIVGGFVLRSWVMNLSAGSSAMQRVGEAIRSGAYAYLSKQVATMLPLVGVLAVALYFLFAHGESYSQADAIGVSVAFLLGVSMSYLSGYIGMGMAVNGNQRTANSALTSYKSALETAFRSGAVGGMLTVGLGLLGATLVFWYFKADAMKVLVGFAFGGSLAALFMRVGGGIFTKAADVGADLVGKVEQDIPEDDPRNAATIADNVGDNVGDCAGMAADVFESYLVTLVAAVILGSSVGNQASVLPLVLFPLVIHGVGILASVLGITFLRGKEDVESDAMKPMTTGLWLTAAMAMVGVAIAAFTLPGMKEGITVNGNVYETWRFIAAPAVGVGLALLIGALTEYFTGCNFRPVKEVADASKTGPATLVLSGISLGLESSAWGAMSIVVAMLVVVFLFHADPVMSAYGIALAGVGLLTTTGFVLAMDTFGPISDNANGIFEMSGALKEQANNPGGPFGERVVAHLDQAGNTTKALTKGFAIATAVIAAVSLFRTFMTDANLSPSDFSMGNPLVFIGILIGGAAPFLFCSFAINAVSRAAMQLVQEVRRQFREMPGIMTGETLPDYARCVEISTASAQRELLAPGILAICLPIAVGFAMGAAPLGGYLAGAIVSGQLMAIFLANSGGAMDNAKKLIEDGLYGGKGTDEHKAAVIGDTVGDPFKDTAGPALNPLIKVMNLVGVLIAGAIVTAQPTERIIVVVVMVALLAGAILFSKATGKVEITQSSTERREAAAALKNSMPVLDAKEEKTPVSAGDGRKSS